MMKYIYISLLLIFSIDFSCFGQTFLAQTNPIDAFYVIESGRSRHIPSETLDKSNYSFTVNDPSQTYILVECNACEEPLSIAFFDLERKGETPLIYFFPRGRSITYRKSPAAYLLHGK